MFKRELKVNFKSFLIWTLILLGLMLMVFLMYPSIQASDSFKEIDKLMNIFPEELLKAFNMDLASMDTAFGWLKTEGFVMISLVIAAYAGILGSNILLKEESDKTIEYLNSLPLKRSRIVNSKVIAGLIYIVAIILLLFIINFIGLSFMGEFNTKQLVLMSITPLLSSIPLYFICMFISTFTHKTKKMLGISIGIVFISYILQTFSTIAESVEFLKYFSVFTLSDLRNVILDIKLEPLLILVSILISVAFYIATLIRYKKKELV